MAQLRASETRQKPISDPEPQALREFRLHVEKLSQNLKSQSKLYGLYQSIFNVLQPLQNWCSGHPQQRELFRHGVAILQRSDAWPLLLQWLAKGVRNLTASGSIQQLVARALSLSPCGGQAPDGATSGSVHTHNAALMLVFTAVHTTSELARETLLAARPRRGHLFLPSPPPPPPLLLETSCRTFRALLSSHILRAYARVAAQAADAVAAAAAASISPARGRSSAGRSGSGSSSGGSSSSGGGGSSSASSAEGLAKMALESLSVACGACAEAVTVNEQLRRLQQELEQARPPQPPQLQRQTLQSEQPVQPLQLQGQPPRRSGKLNGQPQGQPEEAVAQARDVGPSARTSGGRGGSNSGHGGSGSGGGGSGSSSVPQEFGSLLLSEVAASGLLEHCARLLLLSAGGAATAGAGANVGAGAGLAVAGAVSSSSSSSSSSNISSGSSGLFERLWFGLCINASKVGLEWLAHSSSSDSGSGCSSPSSGSCGGVSTALPRSAPPAPPPAPWGSCLQTYAWSQVAATLAAAGFGGGERGVWGLPAELAAGLPLLTSPEGEELTADELRRRARSRGQGVVRLCVEPFQLLLLTLEVGLRCRLLAATAGAEVAAATAGTAAAGPAQEVVVGPARPRAGSGAGGGKRRHGKSGGGNGGGGGTGGGGSNGNKNRSRGETAGPSSCNSSSSSSSSGGGGSSVQPVGGGAGDVWSFPFSPRAAALVLIRSADLAVASVAAPPHTASNKTSTMTMAMSSSPTTPGAAAAATRATTAATALREKAGAVSAPATSQRRAWQQQQQQQGPEPGLPLLRLQRDGASDLALAALSSARQLLLGQWREAAGLLAVERERPPAAAVVEEEAEAGAEAKAYGRGHGRSAGGGGSECGSYDGHSGGSSSQSSSSGGSGGGSNCGGIRRGSRGSGGSGGSAKGDSSCGGGGSAAARTGCGGAADAAIANTNTTATAAAATQGDSGSSSSFPQLPLAWWRSAAAALRCYAGMTPPPPSSLLPSLLLGAPPPPPPRPRPAHHQSDCDCGSCEQDPALRLSTWAREALRAEVACRPEAEDAAAPPLTPHPPRGLAVALAGGIVPAVEAAVRAARHHPEALGIACAFLQVSPHGVVGGGGGWPLFRQLLAFAPPAQTAALVTSIGKRLHAALDAAVAALAPPASANTPAGGSSSSGISGSSSTSGGGAAGGGGGMTRAAAVRHLAQCTSLITSVLPAAAFRTDGGGLAAQRRVWLLVWHAIHRWLPPLARCIRLLQLLDSSDDSGSSSGGGGSSGGGSNGGGSGGGGGGGSSRGSQELLLLCDCYTRYVLEPVAALADRAADAAGENSSSSSSGGGGSSQAVAAAVADAVAGSWRQWLLHEADVLGVCEVAIERLAVKPAGSEPAAAGAAAQLYCLLTYLTAAVPDSLLPVLTGRPAWQRDVLSQALNPHLPAVPAVAYGGGDGYGNGHAGGGNYDGGCGGGGSDSQLLSEDLLERLESLVAAAEAMGLSVSQVRATAFGGPVARAEQLRSMRRPVDEGEQQALAPVELEAAAAAAAAAARVVGLGEKMEEVESEDCGAAGGGGGRAAAVEAAPPPAWAAALRCCSNPRCVNLEGEGEAGLPLSMCGGCRAARYCGGGCQRAHWGGGGHKEACKALRAGGMAAAAGAHA